MDSTRTLTGVFSPTSSQSHISPMGLVLSLWCFGVPGLLNVLGTYVVTPALIGMGMLSYYAQVLPGTLLLALMLLAALVGYRLESRPLNWTDLRARFRLQGMTGKHWLWTIGATVASFILYGWGSQFGHWLITAGLMPLPASLPAWLDPRISLPFVERFSVEAGGLRGNWLALLVAMTAFSFNIIGEEFWWRGYILPRQELAFGKWVWLIHGSMWAILFHAFKWWDLIGMLPSNLLFVYVVWRTQNTTVAILRHVATNIGFVAFVLLGVLGIVL